MKFQQAAEKLKEMAGGKYHSISYEMTTYASGDQRASCKMYIEGLGWTSDVPTWESALDYAQAMLDGTNIDTAQAPE